MVERIVRKKLEIWEQNGHISEDELEIIEYGMIQGIYSITGIVLTLILAAMFGSVTMGILFLLFFMPLRSVSGGYHAKTRGKCFLISCLIMFIDAGGWNKFFRASAGVICIDAKAL